MNNDTYSALDKLDFGSLIGSPLMSCVDAQVQAASATADYIESVGFQYDSLYDVYRTRTFTFDYSTPEGYKRLVVPLISVVPVPFLQINNVNIDFTADVSVSDGQLVGKVSNVNENHVSEEQASTEYTNDLKVSVKIKAGSADMPYGISRLLQIMQENIHVAEQPKPQVVPLASSTTYE